MGREKLIYVRVAHSIEFLYLGRAARKRGCEIRFLFLILGFIILSQLDLPYQYTFESNMWVKFATFHSFHFRVEAYLSFKAQIARTHKDILKSTNTQDVEIYIKSMINWYRHTEIDPLSYLNQISKRLHLSFLQNQYTLLTINTHLNSKFSILQSQLHLSPF